MPIDIDKSFYNAGSATVSNGGTTVTGFGTLWAQSLRAGDLFGTHVGAGVRIATIVSNTQLELAHAWTGPSQTASAYEVQLTPYDVGYQQAVRELLTTMASGNLEALASLAGGADKVPYFTGSGAMSLIDLASLGGGGGGGGAWDALVGTLAGRDQFDGESAGFRVLVADNGDGQAVIYEKTASGWSVPVPFTGPAGNDGPPNTLEVGSVTEGETAYVVIRGDPPNQVVDFILRRGPKGDTGDVTPAALAAQAAAEDARDEAQAAQGVAEGAAATATTKAGEASDSADAAEASASTATTAAGNASTSEVNAAASAATATTKAGEAAASEANAASSASDAAGSASTATTQAGIATSAAEDTATDRVATAADRAATGADRAAAENAADAAETARDFAHDWAQAPEGTAVDDGTHQGYSAYHWSKVAETAAGGGVQQVNGKTGAIITLTPADLGAATAEQGSKADTALQTLTAGANITVSGTGTSRTISATSAPQVNADWNATSGVAQILNKPTLGTAAAQDAGSFVPSSKTADIDANTAARHTHSNKAILDGTQQSFTTALKNKLDGIEAGADKTPDLSGFATTTALTSGLSGKFDTPTGTTSQYIRGNGTLATFPAIPAGTVTSVGMSVPTGFNVTGAITTSGTFTISYASGYQGYTTAEANKLAGIDAGAQVNAVTSVAGKTGAVTLAKGDVGLGNVDNTSDASKPVSTATQAALNGKVTKSGDDGLGGFTSAEYDHGNLPSSFTPTLANGNFQRGNKNAAKTINAPPAGAYSMQITVTNTSGTGGLTAVGFDKVNGQFRSDNGAKHILLINMSAAAKVLTIMEAS